MEFKYRTVDDIPTPTPIQTSYPPHHPSPLPPLIGGFPSAIPHPILPNTSRMPVNDAIAWRREIEKAQIRRGIIAREEVARRVEIEEEVRRRERGYWGIAAAPPHGWPLPTPQVPQLMMAPLSVSVGMEPSPEANKDTSVIILAKPNPDLYAAKRKAVTSPDDDGTDQHPLFCLKKKPKEEWSCALCQVSTTSERGLNHHLQSRKHKAKAAAALRPRKIGTSTHAYRNSLKPGITRGAVDHTMVDKGVAGSKDEQQLVPKSQNTGGLKNGTAATNASLKRRFWCGVCKVRTFSQDVMESHKQGKRHLKKKKKKKFSPDYGSYHLPAHIF